MNNRWLFLGAIVDRRNPANQLRLVVYPIICRVLYISGGAGCLPSTEGIIITKDTRDIIRLKSFQFCGKFWRHGWLAPQKTEMKSSVWAFLCLESGRGFRSSLQNKQIYIAFGPFSYTLPETNTVPARRPSQKETSLLISFNYPCSGANCWFQGG